LLLKCFAECPSAVLVDLSGVQVTRPIVLTVLPAAQQRAAGWPGVPLLVVIGGGRIDAVVRQLAFRAEIPLFTTVEAAEAAAEARSGLYGRLRLHLRPTMRASGQARSFARDACAAWHLDRLSDAVAVIVTELVDNAARHAGTDCVLTLAYRTCYLHVSVADQVATPAKLDGAEPGRGMRLVAAFATAWGTLPTPEGKVTWATLRTGE
jgi:hypothetical protein